MIIGSALAGLLLLGLCAILLHRLTRVHELIYAGCLVATVVLVGDGLWHIVQSGHEEVPSVVLPFGLPWLHAHFRLDSLSAFFLVAINFPAALASLFGIGYGGHVPHPGRVTPLFPLFLFGMNGVLIADDAFVFLVSWEFMSLSSWLLVLSDHTNEEARKAAMVYLVMAVFGTFCLLPAFGLLAGSGGAYTFAAMRAAHLPALAGSLVVLLALLGTGSKAGLVPLHVWLPLAHPAAPSHVSALMSGVMTKVAIYGLIRILYDLRGDVGWQWGFVLMVVGAVSAAMGVLYALMQRDLKTLLAYSTVENVGIIFIALGLALAFRDHGELALSALSLVAALYHVVNHALFKTLLFLGAGAILQATGERNLDRLGGLLNRMPITGFTFLIGACAISALPPLNGFVSEWLVFQSLFKGPTVAHWAMRFGVPVVGVAMALAAAFAATCFVRAFGIAFLGRPRTPEARHAREVPLSMQVAMAVPAFFCLCLGVFPVTVTSGIATAVEPLVRVKLPAAMLGWPWLSPVSLTAGSYSATMVLLTGAALMVTTLLVVHHFGTRKIRRFPLWDCGHPEDIVNAQYSADSFAQPLRRVFGSVVFRAREEVEMPPPGEMVPARFSVTMIDPVWTGLYLRIVRIVDAIADRVNVLQFLTVRRYLLMMFLTLVLLLLVVAVRQQ
ncbi:hydrogenase 4 subunit B [Telmatospirillum siberiense]|uniref:Hydrogenase 4 subunit B n=1 Tax=Telmatospirillum siberiense TaxID=382514 RepID=A0A2N3Q0I2_9PROT|nr:hydrogenase 4 subunit B [Telmatospirillum siberiense]PKU26165.1 hydrogenase 4 subunit B [Telmatospirillum siberiense]